MTRIDQFARVLVDAPGLPPLDYRVPEDMLAAAGDLVLVSLGARRVVGVIAELHSASDIESRRLKSILKNLKITAPLGSEWLQLTRFAASYYIRSWGEAALPAIPLALRRAPTPQQEKRIAGIRNVMPKINACLKTQAAAPKLNDEQSAAVNAVLSQEGFASFLLFGVTGSGKTEVYLHLMDAVLKGDPEAQVLLLVPEINLTPQLVDRVRARFPAEVVAALNSEFTERERAAAWLAAHEGKARILVGTRMAIFASMRHLRLSFWLMKSMITLIKPGTDCATVLATLQSGARPGFSVRSSWDPQRRRLKVGLKLSREPISFSRLPSVRLSMLNCRQLI